MGLSWDISKCKNIPADWREPNPDFDPTDEDTDAKPDQWTDEAWAKIQRAIWQTMAVDTGWELTEANAATFYARHVIWSKIHDEEPLSEMDVYHLIGLSTNVAPVADQTWRNRVVKNMEDELRSRFFARTPLDKSVNKPVKASR